jgi:hypothetical protein
MSEHSNLLVPFVLIRRECVTLDGELIRSDNKLGRENNCDQYIFATTVMERFGEKLIDTPIWTVPYVFPTAEGGIEIATFTEYSGQDRHKHNEGIEIYTVLKGKMEIFVNDEGPCVLNALDEVVIFPGTIHEVIQKKPHRTSTEFEEFDLLVRVHSINCYSEADKYVQVKQDSEWMHWRDLDKSQRDTAHKKQRNNGA